VRRLQHQKVAKTDFSKTERETPLFLFFKNTIEGGLAKHTKTDCISQPAQNILGIFIENAGKVAPQYTWASRRISTCGFLRMQFIVRHSFPHVPGAVSMPDQFEVVHVPPEAPVHPWFSLPEFKHCLPVVPQAREIAALCTPELTEFQRTVGGNPLIFPDLLVYVKRFCDWLARSLSSAAPVEECAFAVLSSTNTIFLMTDDQSKMGVEVIPSSLGTRASGGTGFSAYEFVHRLPCGAWERMAPYQDPVLNYGVGNLNRVAPEFDAYGSEDDVVDERNFAMQQGDMLKGAMDVFGQGKTTTPTHDALALPSVRLCWICGFTADDVHNVSVSRYS
jgi:hypothetical protein